MEDVADLTFMMNGVIWLFGLRLALNILWY